jgi:hypothetical protein
VNEMREREGRVECCVWLLGVGMGGKGGRFWNLGKGLGLNGDEQAPVGYPQV